MTDVLVLLSGGLDSTTCAALAVKDFGERHTHGISFQYGQRHELEIRASYNVAEALNLTEWQRIPVSSSIFAGYGAPLLDKNLPLPEVSYDEIEGVSPTYVPFRNGIFTSIASAIALAKGCDFVYFGAHAEDAANWAYPDCTPEFIGAMAAAIYVGTYHKIRLLTPLQWLDKAAIVALGTTLNAPFHLTRSCYSESKISCGVCPTCRSRRAAFTANGLEDPIQYEHASGN